MEGATEETISHQKRAALRTPLVRAREREAEEQRIEGWWNGERILVRERTEQEQQEIEEEAPAGGDR